MWVVVCFDLPTVSKDDHHKYAVFRKYLQSDGFTQLQKSIYVRHCMSVDKALTHINRVENHAPDKGSIMIFRMTDKEFAAIKIIESGCTQCKQTDTSQLLLFGNDEGETSESNDISAEYLDKFQENDTYINREDRYLVDIGSEDTELLDRNRSDKRVQKKPVLTRIKSKRKKNMCLQAKDFCSLNC